MLMLCSAKLCTAQLRHWYNCFALQSIDTGTNSEFSELDQNLGLGFRFAFPNLIRIRTSVNALQMPVCPPAAALCSQKGMKRGLKRESVSKECQKRPVYHLLRPRGNTCQIKSVFYPKKKSIETVSKVYEIRKRVSDQLSFQHRGLWH